jgi:hypothetical protein
MSRTSVRPLYEKVLSTVVAFGVVVAGIHTDAQAQSSPAKKPKSAAKALAVPQVTVPNGLLVHVVLDSELTSGKAVVGEEFPLHVLEDVVANGYVVVKAGALGAGKITTVTPAGRGTAGSLAYDIVYVQTVDGKKLRLTSNMAVTQNVDAVNGTANDQARATTSSVATSVATSTALGQVGAVLGPLGSIVAFAPGLFGAKKGRDAVVAANTPLNAYVLGTVHVVSNFKATTEAQPGPKPSPSDDGYAH